MSGGDFEASRGIGCMPIAIGALLLALLIYFAGRNGWAR